MQALIARNVRTVPGSFYGSPKEVWGFRSEPGRGRPEQIADEFLSANAPFLKLESFRTRLKSPRIIESLGAWHVIRQQYHRGLRIHRAYVTVHIGLDRRVFLVKNRAVPEELLEKARDFELSRESAERHALRTLRKPRNGVVVLGVERLWFPQKKTIRPAFRVRLHRQSPRREWIIHVDARTGDILSKYDNLAFSPAFGRVFDPNPVVALGDWRPLLNKKKAVQPPAAAYATVALAGLAAVRRLNGVRVTTASTPGRVSSTTRRFLFAAHQPGFEEVMTYFHIDRAIRYLESLGFSGRRALFRAPLKVNARGTRDDNSWYSPGMKSLTFGTGGVDDAEDAEIILHEFGHALQDAICPDFGQSVQAAAMGEGFGDYFAGSFFAAKKSPRYRPTLMTWDAIAEGDPGDDPPCLRRLDEPLTYESFDFSDSADEHENGKIWSATLWDIWNALGRDIADRVVIESHFQLDGFTTFARGARAILDADRNLFEGRHTSRLRQIFASRGIGPVQ